METITNSKKVELNLKDQGRNKSWLANQLNVSRPVLYSRLSDNCWTDSEILKLKTIGLL